MPLTQKTVEEQLKAISFGASSFNQPEVNELPQVLHENETIYECVNGLYEGGVALLLATDMRVLLVDKKPLRYLNVEDLRFDMINEIDYGHRLMGARIIISTGSKTLKFSSFDQRRLRRLINMVQQRMSQIKKEQNDKADNQQQHLEDINRQLQMYLMAQQQQLQQLSNPSEKAASLGPLPKPDPKLADYLFAQRLLATQLPAQHSNTNTPEIVEDPAGPRSDRPEPAAAPPDVRDAPEGREAPEGSENQASMRPVSAGELLSEARREVFGHYQALKRSAKPAAAKAAGYLLTLNLNSTTSSGRIT